MPERRDTNLFEILIGQVTQNLEVNIVLGKALSVLPETELFEPVRNLLHRRPSTDLTLSVLDRQVGEFTNTRQDRVAVLASGRYSITSSARSSKDVGTSIPVALADFRLSTSSNFVG